MDRHIQISGTGYYRAKAQTLYLRFQILYLIFGVKCLCLNQESQIVLLLNERTCTSEDPGKSLLMVVQTCDLPFVPISRFGSPNFWKLHDIKVSFIDHIVLFFFFLKCIFIFLRPSNDLGLIIPYCNSNEVRIC